MSTTYSFIEKQIIIYGGIPVLITGILGGILNALVFLSLRTFRQSSCAFYLTIMSIINIGQMILGILPRILIAMYGSDGTEKSIIYCKLRLYFSQICTCTSLTCLCFAIIDQYFATCSNLRLQQLCNIKLARYVIIISIIFWILHGTPYLIFMDHVIASNSTKITCINKNYIFEQYRAYITVLFFTGFLPISIVGLFGLMAFRNVQHMAYRTVPLVRRELDKQLTVMVLVQVVANIFTLLPFTIINILVTNIPIIDNANIQLNIRFAANISAIIFYMYFASPFYIYICVSERFRRQLIYVLIQFHFKRWRRPMMMINQITPEI